MFVTYGREDQPDHTMHYQETAQKEYTMNNEEIGTVATSCGSETTYHSDGSITITGSLVPGSVGDNAPLALSSGLQLVEEEIDTTAAHK